MSGKFCENFFRRKDFRPKIFFSARKKNGKQKKCLSGGRFANHQSVSMNAQFRGSDFRKNTAIAGQLGGRFLVFFVVTSVSKKSRVPCEKFASILAQKRSLPCFAKCDLAKKRSLPCFARCWCVVAVLLLLVCATTLWCRMGPIFCRAPQWNPQFSKRQTSVRGGVKRRRCWWRVENRGENVGQKSGKNRPNISGQMLVKISEKRSVKKIGGKM